MVATAWFVRTLQLFSLHPMTWSLRTRRDAGIEMHRHKQRSLHPPRKICNSANEASKFHPCHVTHCTRSSYCASSDASAWSVWSITFDVPFLCTSFCILHQVSIDLVSIKSSFCYNRNYFAGQVHVRSDVLLSRKVSRLVWRFTCYSGKTSLNVFQG